MISFYIYIYNLYYKRSGEIVDMQRDLCRSKGGPGICTYQVSSITSHSLQTLMFVLCCMGLCPSVARHTDALEAID